MKATYQIYHDNCQMNKVEFSKLKQDWQHCEMQLFCRILISVLSNSIIGRGGKSSLSHPTAPGNRSGHLMPPTGRFCATVSLYMRTLDIIL